MKTKKTITIKDVAKKAGVSVSAVSRVFNHYGDISTVTQQKIMKAAQELDYIPNQAARKLSSKNKKIIALILNEMKVNQGVTMPLEILSGVNEALNETDYEFVFYMTTTQKQFEKSLKQFCSEHSITGLLIQGLKTTDPYYKELEELSLPTVAIDMQFKNKKIGTISIDNESASKEVVARLIKAGYKKILLINGTKRDEVSQKRESGYLSQVKDPVVRYANFLEKEAYNLIKNESLAEQFDAIFAASDLMAIGVIKALKENTEVGCKAVVGFDDNVLASYVTPTLTTVRQDIQLLSKHAVQDLLAQIEEGEVRHRLLPYEIMVRESAVI